MSKKLLIQSRGEWFCDRSESKTRPVTVGHIVWLGLLNFPDLVGSAVASPLGPPLESSDSDSPENWP